MSLTRNQIRLIIGAVIAVVSLVVQPRMSAFAQELFAEAAILAIFALSLDILARSGLVSFGHAGFLGLGAYAFGGLAVLQNWPAGFAILAAIAIGVIIGLVIGIFAVRTTGAFFIMVTLAMAEMFYSWVFRSPIFNGADGMGGVPRLDIKAFTGLDLNNPSSFATFTIVMCILTWIVVEFVAITPFGRTLDAIRQNANRISALGGRVFSYRLAAFALSGAIGAFAGAMKAQHTNFLSPDLASWIISGDVLIVVVIGGMGTFVGGIIGAGLLVYLKELLSSHFGHWYLFLGGIFIFVALVLPRGIVGTFLDWTDARRARKRPPQPAEGEA
jgi:branched-chain amino acid transport system permease protein